MSKELQEEENLLKQCIEKLKSVEASRVALVSQLKDALHEQVPDCPIIFSFFKCKIVSDCNELGFITIVYESSFRYSEFILKCFQESELEDVRTQMQVHL